MRIARDLAGFTLAEADTLRKAIGKKIKSLLDEQKSKLIDGMVNNGINKKIAEDIWELFPPFARYGFNRSHAACYAMISYQTAYLKAHYPIEFSASLLNISGTDIERVNFLVTETKRLGIGVLPPDVNQSLEEFAVDGSNIRFGLLAIKNLGANIVKIIIEERMKFGPFASIANFLERIQNRDMNKKSLESLIKAGAFDSLGIERGQALENIDELLRFNQAAKKSAAGAQNNLFGGSLPLTSLRLKPATPADQKTRLLWEKELLGLYLTDHPMKAYAEKLKDKIHPIKSILKLKVSEERGPRVKLAGIVSGVKQIFTKTGQPMLFVTLEDLDNSIEMLVFSEALLKYKDAWQENKAILVSGRVSWRGDEPKIICEGALEL